MTDNNNILKYLDFILVKTTDISSFNPVHNLYEELGLDDATEEEKQNIYDLASAIKRLGITYRYFEQIDTFEFRFTDKGIKAQELGGHFKYQKFLKDKSEQSDKKEKSDLKLSEWKLKTFWWIFGFAFIGFGLSLYNFIGNLSPSKNIKQQVEQIEKMESELEKLDNSISDQKNLDSLQNTKDFNDNRNKEISIGN
jgi:hypothetical protein